MRAAKAVLALFAGASCACVSMPMPGPVAGPAFVPHPCPGEIAERIDCVSVRVPESYAEPQGRKIALNAIVFRALAPEGTKAAQFDLEGGPGFAVTDSAAFYASDGAAYRRTRDVVLVDMRGTGGSNPLRCAALEAEAKARPSAPMYPPALVADCARALSAGADLRQYGTAAAARDLEAVRQALGYERIDLNALSYGTTVALRYIADHPDRVRTAVLTGTVPAGMTPPAHHAAAAERGLRLLLAACAADVACARQYPDPWAELDRATRRLGPEAAPVFMEKLRTLLYLPATARGVPKFIHDAANGVPVLAGRAGGDRAFADGLYLAITCAESMARMDLDAALAESRATRFGAYRLERQRDACAQWPLAPPDPKLLATGRYDVPVLFFSGALDPVTPTEWTLAASRMFPNSKVVVVPDGGHVLEGLGALDTCMDPMILRFVEAGSVDGIDTSCVATMRRGPFLAPGKD
jgi:pimeloyl-ACP methyl ester carboxylesterase